jgi:hypothetical protein
VVGCVFLAPQLSIDRIPSLPPSLPPSLLPSLPPSLFLLARQIFERWMEWEPDDHGWTAFVKFELRQQEVGRARAVYERWAPFPPSLPPSLPSFRFPKFPLSHSPFLFCLQPPRPSSLSSSLPPSLPPSLLPSFPPAHIQVRCLPPHHEGLPQVRQVGGEESVPACVGTGRLRTRFAGPCAFPSSLTPAFPPSLPPSCPPFNPRPPCRGMARQIGRLSVQHGHREPFPLLC